MRVAAYARVSTSDRDQDPETQLVAIRDCCAAQGWQLVEEYVDEASASDSRRRVSWRTMMDDTAKRRFQAVVVFKLDRAFRSVKDMHDTLSAWETAGVAFRSVREQFDTSTAMGRLLLNLLASLAEFELEMIRERVTAGMARARKQGKRIGRPRISDQRDFKRRFARILPAVLEGTMSLGEAAKELAISRRSMRRYLDEAVRNGRDLA